MKERFLFEYTIDHMNKSSLTVVNKKTGKHVFIHRNAFNKLDVASDYREIETTFINKVGHEQTHNWIEILVWKLM